MRLKTMDDVELIRTRYPKGTRVQLDYMADPFPVRKGTCGTITHVDDIGQIHIDWDNGKSLAINIDIDEFHVIEEVESKPNIDEVIKEYDAKIQDMENKMNSAVDEKDYYKYRNKLTDLMAEKNITIEKLQSKMV